MLTFVNRSVAPCSSSQKVADRVGQGGSPADGVVAAGELVVAHRVAPGSQHVAQVTGDGRHAEAGVGIGGVPTRTRLTG